jgi:hypothetical protein
LPAAESGRPEGPLYGITIANHASPEADDRGRPLHARALSLRSRNWSSRIRCSCSTAALAPQRCCRLSSSRPAPLRPTLPTYVRDWLSQAGVETIDEVGLQPTLLTPDLRPDSSRRGKPPSGSRRATRNFSEPDPRHPISSVNRRGCGLARLGATVSAAPHPGCPPPALARGLNEKRRHSRPHRDTTRLSCCGVRPTRCTAECDGRVDVGDVCR